MTGNINVANQEQNLIKLFFDLSFDGVLKTPSFDGGVGESNYLWKQ